jgi:hypothetical protein
MYVRHVPGIYASVAAHTGMSMPIQVIYPIHKGSSASEFWLSQMYMHEPSSEPDYRHELHIFYCFMNGIYMSWVRHRRTN